MGIQPDDTSPEKNCPSEGAGAKQENTYADEIISLNEASGHAASGADQAIEFLQWLRPDGPWLILAWKDANKPFGKTCTDLESARAFIEKWNGQLNLYYSLNPTRVAINKKATKEDIGAIEFLFGDLDPAAGETPEQAKARYLAQLNGSASAVVDSGNGIQALWRLADPIALPDPKSPDWTAIVGDVEGRTKVVMESLGADAGTQNIDRILRLPGTVNIPSKTKLAKGRVKCEAKLLASNDGVHALEVFAKAEPSEQIDDDIDTEIDWNKVEEHKGWLKSVADLPDDFNAKGKMIIAHNDSLTDLNTDLKRAKLIEKNYGSWSSVTMALAAIFKAEDRFTTEQIAAALMGDLRCNEHVRKYKGDQQRRAIIRALQRSFEPRVKQIARALPWRECRPNGMPMPSLHNARLAIQALGIECSCDTFHNKMLLGYRGDQVRHELQFVLGEVTDNAIIRLRQIMSDRFGFDLQDKPTRDAVMSLALEHCFDPVRDMLDKAEADWDGDHRLEWMAVDYFNAEDTPLNRAIVRKVMIAAVRRVRQPGCKFDNILVLESPEGWNKSTIWRVLAGDENFSDASILGHNARDVQEQLAGIWIHENADLAGMKKAEVEQVKAFASRQSDDARPAYGYFLKRQARHSIEVGTTNSDEYLQSQTGNRRFWPLRVAQMINIFALKRDRLQLWGEAAYCESLGESITLDEELWPVAAIEQEERRTKDAWEDILSDMQKIIHREFDREFVSSADVLTHMLGIPIGQQNTSHTMRVATVLKRLGWEKTKFYIGVHQVRGYVRQVDKPA